jgi:hypothetical protein
MINKKKLCQFLVKAKRATYASGNSSIETKEKDKSTTLVFEEGEYKYHDNYFGGEPYGGREIVFYKNDPIYIMTYYGSVNEKISDFDAVYKFLQKALSLISKDYPFRGPKELKEDDLIYRNSNTGELDDFEGTESIRTSNGQLLYKAKYFGGFVDQRR